MKIIVWLSFLVFVPLIVGLALVLSGYGIGSWILALGIPAVMIIIVIIGLILLMKGKLFKKPAEKTDNESCEDEKSEKEKEETAINAVNYSHHFASQFKLAEYEADQILEATKHASKKGFVMGIIFFLMLVALAVLATVFMIKQIWIGAIVCAALFGGTIVIILITVAIRQAIAMKSNIGKAKKLCCGVVKFCVMSSMTTKRYATPTVRISNVTYRVVVSADGGEYETFSKKFYEKDEKVVIAVMGKKRAKIVEESDLEKQSEAIKNCYNECLTSGETVNIKQPVSPMPHAGPKRSSHRRR